MAAAAAAPALEDGAAAQGAAVAPPALEDAAAAPPPLADHWCPIRAAAARLPLAGSCCFVACSGYGHDYLNYDCVTTNTTTKCIAT
eukprot:7703905-Pyramimonas_sp.AAC.1